MLPQKRTEASDTEDGRGNFRVRVIGGGQSSGAVLRDEDSRSGLQIGLRIGSASARTTLPDEEDEEEPIRRLGAEDADDLPVKARDMSEVAPTAPTEPQTRAPSRRKKRWDLKNWTVAMALGSCVVAAVAVVAQLKARSAPPAVAPKAPVAAAPVDRHKEEVDFFVNHIGSLVPEAEALLHRYARAKSAADILPLIRNAGTVGPRMTARWKPWGEVAALASGEEIENFVEYKAAWPSLVLKGKKEDFTSFDVHFVREAGVLKIDWEASEGVGDCSVLDLREGFQADNAVVRVKATASNFYTTMFPESGFRSYQLADASGYEFVWAFAPLNSPEAEFLSNALDEDSKILKGKDSKVVAVTLKLSGPKAQGVKIFLITGILHKGWVTP